MQLNEIEQFVEKFNMNTHPEGGFYSEIYRSEMKIPGMERQLMTSIYFLLRSGEISRFHRIKSDELWFFHAGSPLTVHSLSEEGHTKQLVGLDFSKGESPQVLVKAGMIFGSEVSEENSYSLVSCVCAPGFDFRDFELFDEAILLSQFPEHSEVISRLA